MGGRHLTHVGISCRQIGAFERAYFLLLNSTQSGKPTPRPPHDKSISQQPTGLAGFGNHAPNSVPNLSKSSLYQNSASLKLSYAKP